MRMLPQCVEPYIYVRGLRREFNPSARSWGRQAITSRSHLRAGLAYQRCGARARRTRPVMAAGTPETDKLLWAEEPHRNFGVPIG